MVLCQACHTESQFDYDPASGTAYCTFCGSVAEENGIVAEVTFGENSTGAAIVNGAYVGADQTRVKAPGGRRPAGAGGVESREQTIANGRRKIQAMINALKLPDRFADQAQRFYSLALNNNFVRGRRTNYVVSSCLYIVCRMEKTSHMLIDFSDLLQVNVFVLGSTYLKLVKDLNLTIPTIDPSLFISRFASLLEFGDETQQVANDATRLVQRFSRDWMQTGRRPAGICGAAIVLAARMNNFRRSIEEVVQVVKIADGTVKKRLEEFGATPSSALTITDFRTVDLNETVDPPAYLENKEKEKKLRAAQERKEAKKVRFSKSGVLSDDEDENASDDEGDDNTEGEGEEGDESTAGREQTTQGSMQAINAQMADLSNSGLPDVGEVGDGGEGEDADPDADVLNVPIDDQDEEGNIRNALASIGAAEEAEGRIRNRSSNSAEPTAPQQEARSAEEIAADEAESAAIASDINSELATQHYTMISSELADKERARWQQAQNPAALRFNDERKRETSLVNGGFGHVGSSGAGTAAGDTLSDLDEDELDAFILTEDEVRIKERLWMEFNKDYLASVAEKHLRAELDEKPLKKRDRKKKALPRDSSMPSGETAAESTKQLLKQKKFSKKINYAAIDSLLADDVDDEKKYGSNGFNGAGGMSGVAGLTAANLNDFFGDEDDGGDAVSRTSRASSMAPSVLSMASEGSFSVVSGNGASSSSRLHKKRKRSHHNGSSSTTSSRRGSTVEADAEKLKRRIQLSSASAAAGMSSPRSVFTGSSKSILQPTRRKSSLANNASTISSDGTGTAILPAGDPAKGRRASSIVAEAAAKRRKSLEASAARAVDDDDEETEATGADHVPHEEQDDGQEQDHTETAAATATAIPATQLDLDLEDEEEEEDHDHDTVAARTGPAAGEEEDDEMTAEFRRMRGRSGEEEDEDDVGEGGMDDEW